MVAILEPFIDTVVICTLTGLALLTSGVWHEKEVNEFQLADVYVLSELGRKKMSSNAASSIPFTTREVNCPCSTVH